ncbi:adhesion G-protein coupled receptor G2 [Etheostoma cragini]|uniref:adhesion G-protein coupled receptor G2 n=1 Tax=Etheostoma cragini TaxID=417921 RepID=UPI00155ECB64|nr:adhesion G-protein coupled receptor G2 [Etheostoma cragini]
MVILEMSGPVNSCALNELLQQVINKSSGITSERPLTRMVVCGPPGSAVSTLLLANLTWVDSDLLTSDVCQPDPTLLKCEANENLAILLIDPCPPEPSTTKQSTMQPSNLTNSTTTPKALTSSGTNTTAAQNTATVQKTNDSQGTAQPNMTIPLITITIAPLNNQTGHHTVSTTSIENNFTTAATVVGTVIDLNQTEGISVNLSSTASSLTTDFNLTTKGPEGNLTITTYTTTTTTTTLHGTLPAQTTTTTAKVTSSSSTTTLQTTTIPSATTTNPGTGSTFTTIAETTTSQTAREEQAKELLNQTEDASQLNSSQVTQFVRELEKLLEGPTVSQAVGQKVVNIISNLMNADSLALSASANRLVHLVDVLGLKLVVTGDREILSSGSLVLAVRTVDGTNFPITSVDIFNTDNVQLRALSRSQSKRSGSALGSVFLPSSLTTGLSPEQQKQANRVQFTFYTKSAFFQDASLDNKTLVSPVLAASVTNLSISNLSENIQFTIQNVNHVHANYAASCVFWDFSRNGGGGGWSSAGCFVVNSTQEDTTCSCNHLTSFAILLDLSREGIIDHHQAQILTFITYIGCGISAIFLALTLLTYLLFEKLLRDIPAKILVQLCLSLLLLNLVFLLDGWLALYPGVGLCISTAFFLHYFLLTSFTWAGLEALHMYLSIVRVFTPYLSRYMLKFSLIGWGLPLLVVIVVISVDKNNYGLVTYGKYTDGSSDDFCWLRNDIAFYVGVVAYYLLIFALCLLVFIVVMVQLSRIKKQNPQNQPPNRGLMTDLRSIAGLIILLGLTWGFSLFAWGPLYLPFVYLFTIFNSLQGFLVFVFHCAVKENVRRQWRTYLCCGSLRLAENSDWSRTATQNNRNMSVTKAAPLAPSSTSRSSSVISSGTNSSGSAFWDSGISDGPNSDAHLNEIHRQNLSL